MRVKIKPGEVSELSRFIASKCDEIESLYESVITIVEDIPNVWKGNDSTAFKEAAITDINKDKNINKKLRKFGKHLETISKDYIEQEASWIEDLKRVNNNE